MTLINLLTFYIREEEMWLKDLSERWRTQPEKRLELANKIAEAKDRQKTLITCHNSLVANIKPKKVTQ